MLSVADNAHKNMLTTQQRWLEWLLIAAMLLLLGFFLYHQAAKTGFLTEKFGLLEAISLYGPIVLALVAPLVRFFTGDRNFARLFEVAANLALMFGAIRLLTVFPFDFAHLPDILPVQMQLVFAWMTDGFGKVILLLQAVLGGVTAVATAIKYLASRG